MAYVVIVVFLAIVGWFFSSNLFLMNVATMRVVFELKRNEVPEVVLNNLYKQTALQSSFSVMMLAIVDGRPKVLTLRDALGHFVDFRREVVTRRTLFDLRKARERAHVLEGLTVALANLDAVIELKVDDGILVSRIQDRIAQMQARGEPLTAKSNIFTWGAILYELATQQKPFGDAPEMLKARMAKMGVPVAQIQHRVHGLHEFNRPTAGRTD